MNDSTRVFNARKELRLAQDAARNASNSEDRKAAQSLVALLTRRYNNLLRERSALGLVGF